MAWQFYFLVLFLPDLSAAGWNLPNKDCKIDTLGKSYSGTARTTRNNIPCQRWDSQNPHAHEVSAHSMPDDSLTSAADFCRNPDGEPQGPWCFTTQPSKRWDYCNVQECPFLSTNIALHKSTLQSGTAYQGVSSRAVDGSKSTSYWGGNSCSHTTKGSRSWWRVDLESVYAVYTVKLTNRGHQEHYTTLSNFDIRVFNNSQLSTSDPLCYHYAGTVGRGATEEITCNEAVYGRYLYIQLRGPSNYLVFCEVEVYGVFVSDLVGGVLDFGEGDEVSATHDNLFPTATFPRGGILIGWQIRAKNAGTFYTTIWKEEATKWKLVKKNEIVVEESGYETYKLPESERFYVHAGYFIGFEYPNTNTHQILYVSDGYSYMQTIRVCGHDGPVSVGEAVNKCSTTYVSTPALRAMVVPLSYLLVWWQYSILTQSATKMTMTIHPRPAVVPSVTKIIVQYRRITSEAWLQFGGDITPASMLSGVVLEESGLQPGIHEFRAQVTYGDSNVAITTVQRKWFCSAPSEVGNVVGISTKQGSSTKATVTVSWDAPTLPNCDSNNSYRLSLKKNGMTQWAVESTTTSLSYTFYDLDPYTKYDVGVVAVNSGLFESVMKVVVVTTAETVPPGPVTSLTVTSPTPSSLSITWSPPTQTNGVITGYRVGYKLLQNMACEVPSPGYGYVRETLTKTTHRFDKLKEFTKYAIEVKALTSVGYGTAATQEMTTKEAVPGAKPQLQITAITSRNFTLSFRMNCEDVNGGNGSYKYQIGDKDPVQTTSTQKTVTGLTPYTVYTVRAAYCNNKGCGPESYISQTETDQEVPSKPTKVNTTSTGPTTLRVMWSQPLHPNGVIVAYTVKLWLAANASINETRRNLTEQSTVFYNLKADTSYSVQVFSKTVKGYGEGSDIFNGKTGVGKPDQPLNLENVSRTDTTLTFAWTEPMNQRGEIQHYKIFCEFIESSLDYQGTKYNSAVLGASLNGTIGNLSEASLYQCSVRGKTSAGYGDPSETVLVWTAPPKSNELKKLFVLPPVEYFEEETTDSTIAVKLLPVKSVGSLAPSGYLLIVETKSSRKKRSVSKCRSETDPLHVGYADAKKLDTACYVTAALTPDEISNTGTKFVVGDGKTYGDYINRPLEKGQRYRIFYGIKVTVDGVSSTSYRAVGNKTIIAEQFVNTAAIGGGVGALVVVLLIVIIVVITIVRRRRNNSSEKTYRQNLDNELSVLNSQVRAEPRVNQAVAVLNSQVSAEPRVNQAVAADHVHVELQEPEGNDHEGPGPVVVNNDNAESGLDSEEGLYGNCGQVSGRRSTTEFLDYVIEMNVKGKDAYKLEYGNLPSNLTYAHNQGSKEKNKTKNRYANIVPYDKTRVILETVPNEPDSHYINATHITDYYGVKSLIASQGPNSHTVSDFIRMIWETGSNRIVMLTRLVENGKRKCEKYWPESTKIEHHGDIAVTLNKEEVLPDYTIRTLTFNKCGDYRSVTQFHFTVWPDHGVPKVATSLLNFRRKVHLQDGTKEGPVIVHCSAGVGRTGTYIALDYLLAQHRAEDVLDVFGCVQFLRSQRVNMVQTLNQYHFLHNAVAEAIRCGETAIQCSEAQTLVPALMKKNRQSDKSTLVTQFELLRKVHQLEVADDDRNNGDDDDDPVILAALMACNVGKNRDKKIFPSNSNRPILMTPIKGRGDYINATFVGNEIIMTQMPYPDDIVDFWRLIHDHDLGAIVMLNELDKQDKTCVQYWPATQDTYGAFNVEVVSEVKGSCYTRRELKMQLVNRSGGEEVPRTVCHIQLTSWPKGDALPRNSSDLVTVMEEVTQWLTHTNSKRFAVHCMNGAERSGLYVALHATCEKIRLEHEVDVFQAVKYVRNFRSQSVTSVDQYKFIHDAAMKFIEGFETYSNLM